jgi:hypothetical protein
VEDVSDKLLCSPTKISRLETAARRPSLRDVRDLCALYEVDEVTSAEFMTLAKEARQQDWWKQYDDHQHEPYIGLEEVATSITSYTMYYLPGLLQTAEYASAIIRGIVPKIDPHMLQQRVEVRIRRQELLKRANRPSYFVLLDEAVLYRRVGGANVMVAQLDKLLKMEGEGKVAVQIIPFDAGAHAAAESHFVLLEFGGESNLSPIVFVEGLTADHYHERKAEVDRYREAVEYLRDSALSPGDSAQRVSELKNTYVSISA